MKNILRSASLFLLISIISFQLAEAKDIGSFMPPAALLAPALITHSFAIRKVRGLNDSDVRVDKAKIAIRKSVLNKEFLLQSSGITQLEAPMFNGLKSRVVIFRLKNNELLMFESPQGHTATTDLPQNLVLAKFPILSEEGEWMVFDFIAGMTRLFVSSDWRASDLSDESNFSVAQAPVSYLESAEVVEGNILTIRQGAAVVSPFGGEAVPVEIKYYLTPYRPSENFVPTVSSGFDRVGYFEVASQFKDGKKVSLASKFHLKKPMVFAISDNTPPEYREAVRDGVLYWNKAFGEDVVQVIDAPPGVTAPDPLYNVIQWVNYESAGFAYADAQMDPRSGEILHAQVYMTSVFAIMGKARARRLLRDLEEKKGTTAPLISLAGFFQKPTCTLDISRNKSYRNMLKKGLTELLASQPDDATVLHVSQDYVREVIAHEIGHTLGLRHNFAGSLGTNMPLERRDRVVSTYLERGMIPSDTVTSSSVMEYQAFIEGCLTGHQIEKKGSMLAYDEKAIRYLYLDEKTADRDMPLFCTDSHIGSFEDCQQGDMGRSPVEYAFYALQNSFNNYPQYLAEKFIALKTPLVGSPVSLEKVELDPEGEAQALMEPRGLLVSLLLEDAKLLSAYRQFERVTALNEKKVLAQQKYYLLKEVSALGGLPRLLFPVNKEVLNQIFTRFSSLIESEVYRQGIGNNGQPYAFSDVEIAVIKRLVRHFVDELVEAVGSVDVQALSLPSASNPVVDHELGDLFAQVLEKRMSEVLFSVETGKDQLFEIPVEKGWDGRSRKEYVTYALPTFTYSYKVREEATALLNDRKGKDPMWGLQERARLKDKLEAFMKGALQGHNFNDFDLLKVPREFGRWIKENQSISISL